MGDDGWSQRSLLCHDRPAYWGTPVAGEKSRCTISLLSQAFFLQFCQIMLKCLRCSVLRGKSKDVCSLRLKLQSEQSSRRSSSCMRHVLSLTQRAIKHSVLLFSAPCWGEWLSKTCTLSLFYPNITPSVLLPAGCRRYNSSQRVGGRPFWAQRYDALSAEEGQPDQHAHPEGPLLHQETLCLHPQPGVYVEAVLGWVERSQQQSSDSCAYLC